jgi:uncharacterized ferritin-like protein (DUF455 family)
MPAAISSTDLKTVRGISLRRDPAREPCFTIVDQHTELKEYVDNSPVALRERLHRHMNTELQTLEIAARSLAEFVDAPWDLRREIARQCWDEARHVRLLYRRLKTKGGRKGEFPIMNFDWGVSTLATTIAARLALQNRALEGGEMDLLRQLITLWRDVGDAETAALMEAILADEIQHVRFANRWLRRLAKENARTLFDVMMAMRLLKSITEAVAPHPGETNALGVDLAAVNHASTPPSVEDRRLAEFSDEEIVAMLRSQGLGAVVPKEDFPPRRDSHAALA